MVVVDNRKCDECGTCIAVCPADALAFGAGTGPHVDAQRCISCLRCVKTCPVGAISEQRSATSIPL